MEMIDLSLIKIINESSYPSTHHRQGDDGLDVPLDDSQLRHNLLRVWRRVLPLVVDVPVDPSGHREACEVLHLEIQLHHLDVSQHIPARNIFIIPDVIWWAVNALLTGIFSFL